MGILLEKSYYSMKEALKVIQGHGFNFDEDDLRYYGENEKLKFSVHVGSRPAYAARYDYLKKEITFIGHCNLHGIFPISTGDFCGIIANDNHLIELLSGYPYASRIEITNWSTTLPNDVQQLNMGYEQMWAPEAYKQELKNEITFFNLRTEYRLLVKEGTPGAFFPINLIPDNILKDAIKFDLGTPKQWPINQIFKKADLRITHENLQSFIVDLIKQTNTSNLTSEPISSPPSQQIKTSPKINSNQKKSKKNRRSRKCPKLVLLIKSYVNSGNNYDSFARDMLDAYLYKTKPSKDDAMHFNDDLCWIYLTEKSPNKYTFHYSVTNERGKLMARQKSLITLRRYFHQISKHADLKEEAAT